MTSPQNVLYTSGSITVTDTMLRTRRQTFLLRDIEHIECRRPLVLVALPIAVGLNIIGLRFGDLLTASELTATTGIPALGLLAASQVGVLKLRSLTIRDACVWGWHRQLAEARDAVEVGMTTRRCNSGRTVEHQAAEHNSVISRIEEI